MKVILFFLSLILMSCNSTKLQPADTALEALRNYKTACLQGDFDKASFYVTEQSKETTIFHKTEDKFKQLSDAQKRESYAASLTIYSVLAKDANTSVAIVKDSYSKLLDTILLVKKQEHWFVELKQ